MEKILTDNLTSFLSGWTLTAVIAVVTVLVVLTIYWSVLALVHRLAGSQAPARIFLEASPRALAVAVVLMALQGVWHTAQPDLYLLDELQHLTTLVLITALTWTAIGYTHAIGDIIIALNPVVEGRRYYARRVETQVRFMTRVLVVLIVVIGFACALLTFPSVKQVGTSLLASAGIGGLIVGFAARPVLSNLLAGVQIALTQPFRIEDVLNVQGEWCWVEEVTSTYVVLRVWDQRRLLVPLNYFIENPFENWTRNASDLFGAVFLWVDYRMPIEPLREEFMRLLSEAGEWDGKINLVQVTDSGERAMQVRFLMSSGDSVSLWNLRCRVREGLVAFVQAQYPEYLPTVRARLRDNTADDGTIEKLPEGWAREND